MKITKEFQLTPKLASIILPIIIGILSSSALLFLGLFPIKEKVTKVFEELNEYKKKSSELGLILNKYRKTKFELKGAYQTQLNLIDIVTGNSNLKTFFAKLNTLAIESSIRIEKIKPIKVINFTNKNEIQKNNKTDNDSSNSIDPLITPSTFKQITTIELTGSYDNLIAFLQRIEIMENLISINSLRLKSYEGGLDKKINNILEINLNIVSYGKRNV